jgi:cytochrome c-type biogenesis protein CcmH
VRRAWLVALCLFGLLLCGNACAQAIEALPFKNHAEELRYQQLVAQLRCPMCQNETLQDSNAPIAHDLRHQVFQLMQHGETDAQIKQFLVARYSDYILYDPPVKPVTWLLWFGPLLILLAGAVVVVLTIRKRSRAGIPVAPIEHGDDW